MQVAKQKRPLRAAKSMRAELTCRDAVSAMGDFFSAALSPQCRLHFQDHLKDCPDCGAFLRTYKKTIEAMRHAPRSDLPPRPLLKLRKPSQEHQPVKLADDLLN